MLAKMYSTTELFYFLSPDITKLIKVCLGNLRSSVSQAPVCECVFGYLFIAENSHKMVIEDQSSLCSSRGSLANLPPFASGSSIISRR